MPDVVVTFIGGRMVVSGGDSLGGLGKRIAETKLRTADISAPLRAFRQEWWRNNTTIFAAEGIPRWPALSPAYAARKAILFPTKTMLRRTDRLYDSLTTSTADSIYEVGPRSLRMGTMVPYSEYNRRRPHLQVLKITFDRLEASIFEYITRPLKDRN